jgi:hypothetical protein
MESLVEIEKFLLETIWGILIIGAVGSILGGIIIYMVKKLAAYFNIHKESIFLSFLYRYYSPLIIGEKLATQASPSKDSLYICWVSSELAWWITFTLTLLFNLLLISIILLFFGTERPFALGFSISLALLLLHYFIKQSSYIYGLASQEAQFDAFKAAKLKHPKNFKEWKTSDRKKSV